MSINSMLFNGLSGVNSMTGNIGVISDNVANVNTTSFKTSQQNFADLLSQTHAGVGQIGTGSHTGSITKTYSAGQIERTDNSTDLAINNNGFFMLRDPDMTETLYTRDGQFRAAEITGNPDAPYKLVNPAGYFVQGINTGSTLNPTGTLEDITILRKSLPKATENVLVALNLESNPQKTELTDTPLFSSWDGTNFTIGQPTPISNDDFSYSTPITIYDESPESNKLDLTIYFDQTTNDNEQEFLITCDPTQDMRLIGNTGIRYNAGGTTVNKGAGALLYGKIGFNNQGELDNISCWNVPADGNLVPTDANRIVLDRGEGFYSFSYNMTGTGTDYTATLSFGNEPAPQTLVSPGAAMVYDENSSPSALISENTSWSQIYDSNGNKVQTGDVINFTGNKGDGASVIFDYTINFNNSVADLLTSLASQFDCAATLDDGHLQLADNEIGDSLLQISSISYRDINGNSPATNTSLAQIFGPESSIFNTIPENRNHPGPICTTNYTTNSATLYQYQDGYGTGYLEDISVNPRGVISGIYSNGQEIKQAQLMLADFVNYDGLRPAAGNNYLATDLAGDIVIKEPGAEKMGGIFSNSLEMSNVDLARQFVELITTQRAFQANSATLKTADEVYQTALQLL